MAVVVVASLLFLISIGTSAAPTTHHQNEDNLKHERLILCDACVDVSIQMCQASLHHLQVLQQQYNLELEATDMEYHGVKPDHTSTTSYEGTVAPMSAILANTLTQVCIAENLDHSATHSPIVLATKCQEFLEKYHSEIEEFFETFHRKGINCARAVDLMCTDISQVCLGFDAEQIMVEGVATIAYRDPKARGNLEGQEAGYGGPPHDEV